jgi:predicted nucleic acid-binding protein
MAYLIDTSAIYALINGNDSHHALAKRIAAALSKPPSRVILLNFILAESHTLIRARVGHEAARRFLLTAPEEYEVVRVTPEDERIAVTFLYGAPHPLHLSYFDAVLCAAAERLGLKKVFGFDQHFEQMGLELLKGSHG